MTTREAFIAQVEAFLTWDRANQQNFVQAYFCDTGAHGRYIVGETATGDLCLFYIDDTAAVVYLAIGWTDPTGFFAGKTLDELIAVALRGDAKPE